MMLVEEAREEGPWRLWEVRLRREMRWWRGAGERTTARSGKTASSGRLGGCLHAS